MRVGGTQCGSVEVGVYEIGGDSQAEAAYTSGLRVCLCGVCGRE